MRYLFFLFFFAAALSLQAQEKKSNTKPIIVEASCGECNFGLKGKAAV